MTFHTFTATEKFFKNLVFLGSLESCFLIKYTSVFYHLYKRWGFLYTCRLTLAFDFGCFKIWCPVLPTSLGPILQIDRVSLIWKNGCSFWSGASQNQWPFGKCLVIMCMIKPTRASAVAFPEFKDTSRGFLGVIWMDQCWFDELLAGLAA